MIEFWYVLMFLFKVYSFNTGITQYGASLVTQKVKNLPAMRQTWV